MVTKREIMENLKSRVVDIISEGPGNLLNKNIKGKQAKEYSFLVRYAEGLNISSEESVSIVVYDEGEPTERAFYAHRADERLPKPKQ
jgi:hypothetical protein